VSLFMTNDFDDVWDEDGVLPGNEIFNTDHSLFNVK